MGAVVQDFPGRAGKRWIGGTRDRNGSRCGRSTARKQQANGEYEAALGRNRATGQSGGKGRHDGGRSRQAAAA